MKLIGKIAVLALCLSAIQLSAQTFGVDRFIVKKNSGLSSIFAAHSIEDELFIGGDFVSVGDARTGNLLVVDDQNGNTRAEFPLISGIVNEIVDDGSGGVFLAGDDLSFEDEVFDAFVRISADGEIIETPTLSGLVLAMVRSGNNLILAGRDLQIEGDNNTYALVFYSIEDKQFYHTACQGATIIRTLAVNDSEVITGSSTAGNCPGLRSFNISTGAAGSFSKNLGNGIIYAISVFNNNIYVGGSFTEIDSTARGKLAGFKLETGDLMPWAPQIDTGTVYAILAVDEGIFAGGNFTTINAQANRPVAFLDYNGDLINWNSGLSLDSAGFGRINKFGKSGAHIYVAGLLYNSSPARKGVAKFAISNAALQAFHPDLNEGAQSIFITNNQVYLGGQFSGASLTTANNFATLAYKSGKIGDFLPSFSGRVRAISSSTDKILVGGSFSNVNAQNRNGLAIFDLETRNLLATNFSASETVNAIAHDEAKEIFYIALEGGDIARYFSSSGILQESWITTNDNVLDLKFTDGKLYVVGEFTSIAGQNRTGFAEINAASGSVTAVDLQLNDKATSVAVNDNFVAISGNFSGGFTSVLATDRLEQFALLNRSDMTLHPFNPNLFNGNSRKVIISQNLIYILGAFDSVAVTGFSSVACDGIFITSLENIGPIVFNPRVKDYASVTRGFNNIIDSGDLVIGNPVTSSLINNRFKGNYLSLSRLSTTIGSLIGIARDLQSLSIPDRSWIGSPPIVETAFAWQRCDSSGNNCTNINGANASTYTLTGSDVGSTIRTRIAVQDFLQSSEEISPVSAVVAARNSALPAISGEAHIGQVISCSNGSWGSATDLSYRYGFLVCDDNSNINSCIEQQVGISSNFAVVQNYLGKFLRCRVYASKNGSAETQANSVASNAVTAVPTSTPTSTPTMTPTSTPSPTATTAPTQTPPVILPEPTTTPTPIGGTFLTAPKVKSNKKLLTITAKKFKAPKLPGKKKNQKVILNYTYKIDCEGKITSKKSISTKLALKNNNKLKGKTCLINYTVNLKKKVLGVSSGAVHTIAN